MESEYKGELYSSISIPSTIHAYSLGLEYIKKWFLGKFGNDYFKTIHVDGKHVLDDFRDFNVTKSLKKLKPSLAIIPEIDLDYDFETISLYESGLDLHTRRSSLQHPFFKDDSRDMYLSMGIDRLKMDITFRVRVSTRAQQIDLYKFIRMAFRVGTTQGEKLDLDFHIPHGLMVQVAKDAGYEVEDGKIVNITSFVRYMNSHSLLPITYKLRTINGKSEFFMRVKDMYTHISCLDNVSYDSGERDGMVSSNYMLELPITLKIAAPKMFIYHSLEKHAIPTFTESESTIGLYNIKLTDIPDKNEKGWDAYLTTGYKSDVKNELIDIDLTELFDGTDLGRIYDHNSNMCISPKLFLDFKLFSNAEAINYEMDWNAKTLKLKDKIEDYVVDIAIYADLNYVHESIITMDNIDKSRFDKS